MNTAYVAQPFRAAWRPLAGLKACATSVASLLLVGSLAAQAPSPNWPQFRGNGHLTGVAAMAPPATLALKWTYEAGESIESSAAVVDGVVYVGSTKGELIALDLETGRLRWKYETGSGGFIAQSSPAGSDG